MSELRRLEMAFRGLSDEEPEGEEVDEGFGEEPKPGGRGGGGRFLKVATKPGPPRLEVVLVR